MTTPDRVDIPARVVIVEDEWMVARLIEGVLTDAGIEVVGKAATVETALQLIAAVEPNAVVLDANLDGKSAEPVAQALQAQGIPFLIVSGYAHNQRNGLLGAAPCVTKPFDPQSLVTAVHNLRG